jgi:aminotransferase
LGFKNDRACTEWLTKEVGVAGVPGSSFFSEEENRYVRFHFAKREETLQAAGERLVQRLREK